MKKKFRCDEAFMYYMELNRVLNQSDVEFPADAIIHGRRNIVNLGKELDGYIKIRDEQVDKFGEVNVDGLKTIKITKLQELMKEYNKVEIEVDIATVKIDSFMKFAYRPADLIPFEFMIE